MSVATLTSDLDTIAMFNGSNYKILDGTLEISDPEKDDVRVSSHRNPGRNLKYLAYRSRQIKFTVQITDVTDANVSDKVVRLSRMLIRASSMTHLEGGMYNQTLSYTGRDTGDQGVIFQFRIGDDVGNVMLDETGTVVNDPQILTARVVAGDITQSNLSSTVRKRSVAGVDSFFRDCQVTLEVEPIFTRQSRIVAQVTTPGFAGLAVAPTNSNTNRIIVAANSIPGDVEALTRISTQINGGQGILMGRDVGISILNCTSKPVYTAAGTAHDDFFCYGDVRSTTGHTYTVKIVANSPDKFQWKFDATSFSSSVTIVPYTFIQLGATGIYVYFQTLTGHVINDQWVFVNNQAFFAANVTYDAYTNRAQLYQNDGTILSEWPVVVPPGCTSKYKCYVSVNSAVDCEYTMKANFLGYGGPSGRVTTGSQTYDWVKIPGGSTYVDLGVIDLTPSANPYLIHPGILTEIDVAFYARSAATITVGQNIVVNGMYLIPCPDEHSYFHAVWTYDGYGREIYCNYDPANPYIAEVAANFIDNISTPVQGTGLNATYAGNIITLVPGVDNTIIMVPIFSAASMDWRLGTFSAGTTTGGIYLAIRPRYLQV